MLRPKLSPTAFVAALLLAAISVIEVRTAPRTLPDSILDVMRGSDVIYGKKMTTTCASNGATAYDEATGLGNGYYCGSPNIGAYIAQCTTSASTQSGGLASRIKPGTGQTTAKVTGCGDVVSGRCGLNADGTYGIQNPTPVISGNSPLACADLFGIVNQ